MTNNEEKYTREEFANSKKYKKNKDLIYAVLKKDEQYSIEEADMLILAYKERRI